MLHKTLVLGAGSAGLFYAATRKPGGKVILFDHQERAGRKLLLSGGGKCNFTNLDISAQNYLCSQPGFTSRALSSFDAGRILDFVRKHGLSTEEREFGQMFLRRSAEELRNLLVNLAEGNGTRFVLGRRIEHLYYVSETPLAASKAGTITVEAVAGLPEGARFCVEAGGKQYLGQNLLLATGGPSWPKAGASSAGHAIAKSFGHKVISPRPALTPLKMPEDWPLHGLQGLSVVVEASAGTGPSFIRPLLFTHSGISGPACLQISSYLDANAEIILNFLPGQSFATLLDAPDAGKSTPLRILRTYLPERLARALLSADGPAGFAERKCAEISRTGRQALHAAVHRHSVRPLPASFNQAESSSGGVDTSAINPKTMQSNILSGLYFAGEVMDVCGQLGGYNLHWAWASAWCAGRE